MTHQIDDLRWLSGQFKSFELPSNIPPEQSDEYKHHNYCSCFFLQTPNADNRTENRVVRLAIKHIFLKDSAKMLNAMEALGMPLNMRDFMCKTHKKMTGEMFGFFDDLATRFAVNPANKATNRTILHVLANVCWVGATQIAATKVLHKEGKADQTRETILKIIKPLVDNDAHVSQKRLISAVVQARVCKTRQAESHIRALVKRGDIPATWRGKSLNPRKSIARATRRSVGRTNPAR